MQALKRELLKLKLPSQEFAFSFASLSLADDAALAVAYASALHLHAQAQSSPGSPSGVGMVDALSLDAAELIHQLQHRQVSRPPTVLHSHPPVH